MNTGSPVSRAGPDAVTNRRLRLIGVWVSLLVLWNGAADLIYGYSPQLSGVEYFTPAARELILTGAGRPQWLLMLAQTAGWLYPVYALFVYHWWVGMRRAGFWLADVPALLLAYSVVMIGGIQHAGWAFLSVPARARALVGSTDPDFHAATRELIVEHFVVGDLTAALALTVGAIWQAVGILSGRTLYPRWFVVVSPLGVLLLTAIVGVLLPAPLAGLVLAPFGTWFMLVPLIASTVWLWNTGDPRHPGEQRPRVQGYHGPEGPALFARARSRHQGGRTRVLACLG